jgi:hypothetical protein
MIDPVWLSAWIQPQHLERDSLQAYHQTFTSHPARLVVLKHFLLNSVAEQLSRFLTDEAEFQPAYGLFSQEDYVTEEAWRAAEDHDRFFKFRKLAGVCPEFRLSPNLQMFLKFRAAVFDPNFRAFFEGLSGLRLGTNNFTVHAMKRGDFLLAHSDNARDRCLAFVFYLSPNWDPSFGGALHMVERGKKAAKVEAEHNSLVVFDVTTGSEHFIAPIDSEQPRMTASGWFYRPEHEERSSSSGS